MAVATRLGPWLLGTVKDTTGTTPGTVRNIGATCVTQTVPLVAGTAVTMMIPAGSLIHSVYAYMSTGAAGTPNVTLGGTVIGTLSTAAGLNGLSVNTTNIGLLINTGSTDAVLSYTATAATAGTLAVQYVLRNPDGTTSANV
jgi:hypothetical protein